MTGEPAIQLGKRPKYWKLQEWLTIFVESNPPGTLVPPERQLCEEFQLSRMTVRKAMQEFIVEGWLARVQGRGTFVAQPKWEHRLRLHWTDDDIEPFGGKLGSRLVLAGKVEATADVAASLGIKEGAEVLRVERLRLVNGEPMAIDINIAAVARFPDRPLPQPETLHSTFANESGVTPAYADETIETGLANPHQAQLLNVEVGLPLLILTRQTYDDNQRPLEWARSAFRGDRYKFVTRRTD